MTTAAICATRELSWRSSFYRGEQFDLDLGLYYLRARYYNPATGGFLSRDPLDGNAIDPASLHKYLYANGDPINGIDPMGREDLVVYVVIAKVIVKTAYDVLAPTPVQLCWNIAFAGLGLATLTQPEIVLPAFEANLFARLGLVGAIAGVTICHP
jgi:RHS repeat-associated protein